MNDTDRGIAIGWTLLGKTNQYVANAFKVNPSTISRLNQKYRETGNVADKHKSGRPKSTTQEENVFLMLHTEHTRAESCTGGYTCCKFRIKKKI